MSSYLTIYGVPKNEGKPIDIVSFSRSHCIYSAICDEVNVAWAGESEVYTNLNTSVKFVVTQVNMKFKLEFTFDISDSSLLIDANDGRSEEYTSLEDVPEDTLMDVVYNYLDGVIEGITYDQITVKKL